MKLHKRVLKLHHFRNLGKNSPTELLLNSSFDEKHGGYKQQLKSYNNP
ncbi:hypothetical protein HPHPH29_0306 [Helicobacter pylori Hp H-29]|nr:hypothetical protein [Helicobacter pylori]EJB56760.1 hypothetical protein HPHPH29_0306 [Helicobacter pylori Hp H-29]